VRSQTRRCCVQEPTGVRINELLLILHIDAFGLSLVPRRWNWKDQPKGLARSKAPSFVRGPCLSNRFVFRISTVTALLFLTQAKSLRFMRGRAATWVR
jgi:hypothetical protein